MPKVAVYNINGDQVDEIELNENVFGIPVHRSVLHDAVVAHLAGQRKGTHDTKTRSEISGGGRKPWRQKGTGRARQGTTRSPIWRGGGTVFGPHPRDYSLRLNKKVKRLAIKSALSSKVESGNLIVLDSLTMEEAKTKAFVQILNNLKIDQKALVVIDNTDKNDNVIKSARNIAGVKPVMVSWMNTYDVLAYPALVMTKDAVVRVEEVLA